MDKMKNSFTLVEAEQSLAEIPLFPALLP